MAKIKVGISACLLGQPVRYDGGHKHAKWMTDAFSQWFDFQPICPEVEVGMGVPREPIHLVQIEGEIRVRAVNSPNLDYTSKLNQLADQYSSELESYCGYIFMQKSPSCGLHVKVSNEDSVDKSAIAAGAFSSHLIENHPQLPVVEVARLAEKEVRAHFLTRVFTFYDWQKKVLQAPTVNHLKDFHRRHWLLFKAHCASRLQRMDDLLAGINCTTYTQLLKNYEVLFSACLAKVPGRDDHMKVMFYLLNDLKTQLEPHQLQSLELKIGQYQNQLLKKSKLIKALLGYIKADSKESLLQQKYFAPFPSELL